MNKKQILCTGLSLALLLSSVITTPASIAAGKYFKIQYIHSKKKVKKKAINARYNNKVISTKFQDILKVLLLCILHTGSSVTVLLLEQNIHIQVPKKELHYNEILRNL